MPRSRRRQFPAICSLAGVLIAAALAAACGASGTTMTAPATSVRCAVTTTASGSTLGSAGGTATITVSTERECQWTATSDNAWLKVTAGSAGQGPGTVELAASANATPSARTAAVVVNDQRVNVTQAAADCGITLSDASKTVSSSGGSGSVDVRASSEACPWTASSNVSWIAITSGASGTGSGAVTFAVSATTAGLRSATLTIAGLPFVVNQTEGCSYQITPATFAAAATGGETSVMVTAGHDCPWSAASTASWISVSPASGSGTASVAVSVAPAAGAARTGTATIAGQTFTVTQSQACTVTIAPASASIDAAGGTGQVDVGAGGGCGWAAASGAAWLTITSGASGTGNGAVVYSASANGGPARTATIAIADRTFSVAQAGGCTVSLGSPGQPVPSGGATVQVGVTAAAGCDWSATSAVSWITIAAGASGSGNGLVQLVVAPNTDGARTGTVSIGGQTFTITQEAPASCTFAITPSQVDVGAGDGKGTVAVRALGGCEWTAISNVPWITITAGASGSGDGSVKYTFDKNPRDAPARTGTVTIAGQLFTVKQKKG